MVVYDDKSKGVIATNKQLILTTNNIQDDVTFKASFIISSGLHCKGKITALFDLVVFGDVDTEEIDIKGRFVCLGKCTVKGTLSVQNDIWAEDIQASSIICRDRIVAQSIDAKNVYAENSIIVGKTLAIEEKAETIQDVLCGETAYGAGKIIASRIVTTDPLDLDDGAEALESPFSYIPQKTQSCGLDYKTESAKYAVNNDYSSFLKRLASIPSVDAAAKFKRYLMVLKAVELSYPSSISEFTDISLLLWMIEIVHTDLFSDWPIIIQWTDDIRKHFENLAEGRTDEALSAKPAKKLMKGYTVSHSSFGQGVVESVTPYQTGSKAIQMVSVNFTNCGQKKFPIPDSLKYFVILSESTVPSSTEIRSSITCEINNYNEWLTSLMLINQYKDYLGDSLHSVIFELLLGKIGLRSKFVEDRFKEKGWS